MDGKSIGMVSKGKSLSAAWLAAWRAHGEGRHAWGTSRTGRARRRCIPASESTVSIKILIPRRRNKAATELLDKGIELYQKGSAENYNKAAGHFEKALQMDPTYSQAAFYLGLTYNSLFDEEKAAQYYKKAIEIDPDYLEARANYAGMLLDIGRRWMRPSASSIRY